jgi:hypothetical protein
VGEYKEAHSSCIQDRRGPIYEKTRGSLLVHEPKRNGSFDNGRPSLLSRQRYLSDLISNLGFNDIDL